MTQQEIELLRIEQDVALKREQIQADVKKVVYGTLLLGVAVALFPVISGFIEHYFNLRIESEKQINALALQANQLSLDLKKLERENQLALEAAKSATEQSDRTFFETIADEARSAALSDRITIAEFFAFVARDSSERERWTGFLAHLKQVQAENNTRRSELLLAIGNVAEPKSVRDAAARELAQIDERESGVTPVNAASRWQQLIPIPAPETTGSAGVSALRRDNAVALLGVPIAAPNDQCQRPDNPSLAGLIETRPVGSFSATLIEPALASLERVMADLKSSQPDLYAELGTAGTLCARLVRGSSSVLTNHSWGTAIDITIGGKLNLVGSAKAYAGLVELSKYFAKEGWFWGGNFVRSDPAHFEVSDEKLAEWGTAGLLTSKESRP